MNPIFISNVPRCCKSAANVSLSLTAQGNRSQQVLVVSQIAIVTLLLTGTGLLIETLQALRRVELGFDPHHLMIVGLKLPGVRYRDRPDDQAIPDMANLYAHIVDKVKAVPGVDSAAISDNPPFVHIKGEESSG